MLTFYQLVYFIIYVIKSKLSPIKYTRDYPIGSRVNPLFRFSSKLMVKT